MPFFMRKRSTHVVVYEFLGQRHSDYARAQNQDIHVVMLDTLMRRIRVMTQSSSNSRHLVRGDRCTDTAAADEDRALYSAVENALTDRFREIRIIDRIRVVRS